MLFRKRERVDFQAPKSYGASHVFTTPQSIVRRQQICTFTVVLVLCELLIMLNVVLYHYVPLYSFWSRIGALAVALGVSLLASITARFSIRDKVVIDAGSIRYIRGRTEFDAAPVPDVVGIEFGWFQYFPGQRNLAAGVKFSLKNGCDVRMPAKLIHEISREKFENHLRRRFASLAPEGRISSPLGWIPAVALMMFSVIPFALLFPIFIGSIGDEVLAVTLSESGAIYVKYNGFDLDRGFHFNAILPLSEKRLAIGTERQGVWIFDPNKGWQQIEGTGGYVMAFAEVEEGSIAVGWSDSREEHWDHADIGVIRDGALTNEYRVSLNVKYFQGLIYREPFLYASTGDGLYRVAQVGQMEKVVEGWCSNLKKGPNGDIYIYHQKGEWPELIRLTQGGEFETELGEKECPNYYTFDENGRLWCFWVGGMGIINPPNGRVLPQTAYLIKGTFYTPGRVWVRLMDAETAQYGLGFWNLKTVEFEEVISPSDPGNPSRVAYGYGLMWIGGEGPLEIPSF